MACMGQTVAFAFACVLAPSGLVAGYQSLRGTGCFHVQDIHVECSADEPLSGPDGLPACPLLWTWYQQVNGRVNWRLCDLTDMKTFRRKITL